MSLLFVGKLHVSMIHIFSVIMNIPLTEQELERIVESEEFWEDLERDDGRVAVDENNEIDRNYMNDKRSACRSLLSFADDSDKDEEDEEELS